MLQRTITSKQIFEQKQVCNIVACNFLDQDLVYASLDPEYLSLVESQAQDLLSTSWSKSLHSDFPSSLVNYFEEKFDNNVATVLYKRVISNLGSETWILSCFMKFHEGYLEICLKPNHSHLNTVEQAYKAIVKNEILSDLDSEAKNKTVENLFESMLIQMGYWSYEHFMKDILRSEYLNTVSMIGVFDSYKELNELAGNFNTKDKYNRIDQISKISAIICENYLEVERLSDLKDILVTGADRIKDLSQSFNIISLNTSVKSLRLQTRTIGTVATHLQESAICISKAMVDLSQGIRGFLTELQSGTFYISLSSLCLNIIRDEIKKNIHPDMVLDYDVESTFSRRDIRNIRSVYEKFLISAGKNMIELNYSIANSFPQIGIIEKQLLSLEHIQNIGLMESAITTHHETFDVTFLDIKKCLDEVKTEFYKVTKAIQAIEAGIRKVPLALKFCSFE